ncbi:MAG: Flp pilus assembly complex ATPase component TadA [Sterolibacterium sp.]|nr:Flp pilus assembly complex ATPase component TadA [Sterolibacterium sp.]
MSPAKSRGASTTQLAELLISRGLLSQDQLRIALQEQHSTAQPLDELLVALGFIAADQLRDILAEHFGQQAICLKNLVADAQAIARIPRQFARHHQLFPVSHDTASNRLLVASASPEDIVAADQLHALLDGQLQIVWRRAASEEIQAAIERFYDHELSLDGILQELETGVIDEASLGQTLGKQSYRHPIVRLVDSLLSEAIRQGASDIHFEPEAQFLRLRYRIDGVLRQAHIFHLRYWSAMLVRLKVMAGMNIAETRAPQDGRIAMTIAGKTLDLRCAAQPTIHGENLVLRILDHQRGIVPLEQLGVSASQLLLLKRMLARPEGLLLLTGPTGSGKTTTLYAILAHLNASKLNIMTLEDPVEYALPGIRQTSLSDAVKLDFAEGVRALLRQDPDIILIGEIRDPETASMALRAAMTGHQVFSTLHANSTIRAIPRLLDLGISPASLAGNLLGIIAQRLLRTLCPQCKQADLAQADALRLFAAANCAAAAPVKLYRAKGCADCGHTGYRGRTAVIELLRIDPGFDELIANRASLRTMHEHAASQGFVSLAENALRLVQEGLTSLEEVARVIDLTELDGA